MVQSTFSTALDGKKKKKKDDKVICSLLKITISDVLFLTNKVDERFLSEAALQIL